MDDVYTNPILARANNDNEVGVFIGENDDPETVTVWYGNIWDALIEGHGTNDPECWCDVSKTNVWLLIDLVDNPRWVQYNDWIEALNEEAKNAAT